MSDWQVVRVNGRNCRSVAAAVIAGSRTSAGARSIRAVPVNNAARRRRRCVDLRRRNRQRKRGLLLQFLGIGTAVYFRVIYNFADRSIDLLAPL